MNYPKSKVAIFIIGIIFISALAVILFMRIYGGSQSGDLVKIDWWILTSGDDPRIESNRQIAKRFMDQNPNVTINITTLSSFRGRIWEEVKSGNSPDLFQSWGGYVMFEFAQMGELRDITYFVNSKLSKRISHSALDVYSYSGNYYGAPYDMGAVVMWYNKDIFKVAGVSVPKTWDELKHVAIQLKSAGYTPFALGAKDRWPVHFWWVYLAMRIGGSEAFNTAYWKTGSFSDPVFVQAGEKLLELQSLDAFQPGYLDDTYSEQEATFGNGLAAMELMGQWAPVVSQGNSESGKGVENIGIFSFPAVEGGAGDITDVLGGGNGYILGKNAPDETLNFLDYFLSTETQMEMIDTQGIVPVDNTAQATLSGYQAEIAYMVGEANYFQLYYDQYLPTSVGEVVNDAVYALVAGEIDPEETAAIIDEAWQKMK